MARKVETIQTIIDDYTGQPIETPIARTYLSIEGKSYELDLAPDSVAALRAAVEPFIKNAEPLKSGTRKSGRSTSSSSSSSVDEVPAGIVRAWAKENGIAVDERGRLSKELKAQYLAAN